LQLQTRITGPFTIYMMGARFVRSNVAAKWLAGQMHEGERRK